MLELVKAGGWPMIPLLLLSALGLAIIVERFWTLRRKVVLPAYPFERQRYWFPASPERSRQRGKVLQHPVTR